MTDIVNYYSSFDKQKSATVASHIDELQDAAQNIGRWIRDEASKRKREPDFLVECYAEFAIDLGINSLANTELNMSEPAKMRRKAI